WQTLQTIEPGKTMRYGELAATLGSHARAVARACASNPIGLLVPCHRVVRADQAVTGYRWGGARKSALLAAERKSAGAWAGSGGPICWPSLFMRVWPCDRCS